MGGKNRQASALKAVRQRLSKYGVSKDEALVKALDRLLEEHASAVEEAGKSRLRMLTAIEECNLAKRGRDAAQEASSELVMRERCATFENRALRKILTIIVADTSYSFESRVMVCRKIEDASDQSKTMAAEAKVARFEDELLLSEQER